jgi:tellurite resistance protein
MSTPIEITMRAQEVLKELIDEGWDIEERAAIGAIVAFCACCAQEDGRQVRPQTEAALELIRSMPINHKQTLGDDA